MPKVSVRTGINVHYLQAGEGPDLVLIHGLTGNLAVWHLKMVPLLRERFRVLTYDLRGHGYSDMPPAGYTVSDLADDLLGLLDALEIERPHLVGHSYGADTALQFAYRYPERVDQVVAIEAGLAALIDHRKREEWEGWLYWSQALERFGVQIPRERRTDIAYMLRESLQIPKIYGPATGRPRKAEPLLRLLDTTSMVSDYEVVCDLTPDNIARITTPVTLIYGSGSAFLGSFRFLRQQLPHAKTIMLPDSAWGHFGPLEQPEMLTDHLVELLAASDPAVSEIPA